MKADIQLRQAGEADTEFIYAVAETTMRPYVEQLWGTFNEAGNRKNIADAIAAGFYSVIIVDGLDVGAVAVERRDTHIQLAQLYVLPSHQNRGIGTCIVRRLIEEAKQLRKPLRLRVLSVNPARSLYEREGFRVTSQTPERIFMELHV